jgi:hypothetical protein
VHQFVKGNPPRVPLARWGGFLNPFSFHDMARLGRGAVGMAGLLPGTEGRVEEERVLDLEEMEKFY